MKTERIAMLYGLLKQSRTTKMDDAGRLKVLRIIKALRPAAQEYDNDVAEAREKMKDERFAEMSALAEKWDTDGPGALSDEEKAAVNRYFTRYQKRVADAAAALGGKPKEVKLDRISQEEFLKLISSNDYTGEQTLLLDDIIVADKEQVSVFAEKK